MLHETLKTGQVAIRRANRNSMALSRTAMLTGKTEDHVAAIRGARMLTEATVALAVVISGVIETVDAQNGGQNIIGEGYEEEDECPNENGVN